MKSPHELLVLVQFRSGTQPSSGWEEYLGNLKRLPGAVRLVENVATGEDVPMPMPLGPLVFDRLVQVVFPSRDALLAALQHDSLLTPASSLEAGLKYAIALAAHRREVIVKDPTITPPLKRMSLLFPDPTKTRGEFQAWWTDVHGPKVAKLDAMLGVAQLHVIAERCMYLAENSPDIRFPDGVTELYLQSIESMLATLQPQGTGITGQAAQMIHQLSPHIVREEVVRLPADM
ncbi:MAG: EthD domain-containing protein [Ottowia sp.]|uniref:EthD domain-containing protein n=1 Tax=Ottowia sp. TaxID=1898956 RepID=UPI0039E33EB6